MGRSRYSAEGFYNYTEDDRLLRENPKVKQGFSFAYGEKRYFCYRGRLSKEYPHITCVKFKKLPMDPKHKTKLDYTRVIRALNIQTKK